MKTRGAAGKFHPVSGMLVRSPRLRSAAAAPC